MTNVPAPIPHASHDLALIAAHASGDVDGQELDRAIAMVGACDECARLYADLVTIGTAMAAMPAPARPRDFRLTEEQAAALRPRGWRALLAAVSGPRFSFAAPLGTAMATLGLVALLLAGPGLPFATSSPASDMALGPTADQPAPESIAGAAAASPGAEAGSPVTDEAREPGLPAPSGTQDLAAGGFAAESPGDGATAPGAGAGSDTADAVPGTNVERTAANPTNAADETTANVPLMMGAGLVLLAGLLLVGLRLIARRVA